MLLLTPIRIEIEYSHHTSIQIQFPLKRKGCQVEVSVLIVLLDIWELLLMIVTFGTQ